MRLFNESASGPCDDIHPNLITMRIQPDEGISLRFGAKVPSTGMSVCPVIMDFSYAAAFGTSSANGYERLLLDAMLGDATLFAHRDGVEATWSLVHAGARSMAERTGEGLPQLSRRQLGAGGGGRTAAPRWARVAEDVGWNDCGTKPNSTAPLRVHRMSVTTVVTYQVLPDGEKLARAMAEQMLAGGEGGGRVARRRADRHLRRQHAQAHLRDACRSGGERVQCFPVGQD